MPQIPNPYRRTRPINPGDTALTTGLPVNPNGTYIANPFPTTAQNGAQGGYGAMLPKVQVTSQGTAGQLANIFSNPQAGALYNQAQQQKALSAYSGNPNLYGVPKVAVDYADAATRLHLPQATNYVDAAARAALRTGPDYADAAARSPAVSPLMQDKIISDIAENPEAFNKLTPAQKDAIENTLTKSAGGGGNNDFMKTKFMQQNTANGVDFLNQKRWDPSSKKFVSIGKLLKQGKLDLQGRRHKGRGRGKNSWEKKPTKPKKKAGFTGAVGVVNFDTGTG